MQLLIWAELIASGSTSELPYQNSIFQRAGSSSSQRKSDQGATAFTEALTDAATAVTCVLTQSGSSKRTPRPGASTSSSPAKMIDSRPKLYKQLSELQNLRSTGMTQNMQPKRYQSWIC